MAAKRWPAKRTLERVYAEHAPAALRLAYVLTGDPHRAEDVVQDAFERVSGRFLNLTAPDRFRGYLYRTIVNLVRDEGRRAQRARRAVLDQGVTVAPAPDDEADSRRVLWELLQKVPERQRVALFLRYYEDRSEAETAEVLGCSRSAVKSLVLRGLRALREAGVER